MLNIKIVQKDSAFNGLEFVQARRNAVEVCGSQTGHVVYPIAFTSSEEQAQMIAYSVKHHDELLDLVIEQNKTIEYLIESLKQSHAFTPSKLFVYQSMGRFLLLMKRMGIEI